MKSNFLLILLCTMGACSVKNGEQPTINLVNSPSRSSSAEPSLFTDKDSTVYLSWVEKNDSIASFMFSSFNNNQWSEPRIIAAGKTWFVNWADYPMMATHGNYFVAHFLDKNGAGSYAYDTKLTLSNDGGKTWSEPQILHVDKKQAEHGFVTLLPYGDNFFVTWLDGRNASMEGMEDMKGMKGHEGHFGSMSLRAAIIDNQGKKISEWELDNKTCDCCQTSAAITDNGPVVVYRDRSDEEIRDMSIVRLVDGQWTKPQSIHDDHWKIAGCPVNGPRIEAVGNNLAAAWFSLESGTPEVNVIFSTDGGANFGKPIRVDEGNAIGRVDIVWLDDRDVMVSWMEGSEIKIAKVNKDGSKDDSITIATASDSRSSGFPQMTRSGNQLIFAWTDDQTKNIKLASVLF